MYKLNKREKKIHRLMTRAALQIDKKEFLSSNASLVLADNKKIRMRLLRGLYLDRIIYQMKKMREWGTMMEEATTNAGFDSNK